MSDVAEQHVSNGSGAVAPPAQEAVPVQAPAPAAVAVPVAAAPVAEAKHPVLTVSKHVTDAMTAHYGLKRKDTKLVLEAMVQHLLSLYHRSAPAGSRRMYWSELARQGLVVILSSESLPIDEERAYQDLRESDCYFGAQKEEYKFVVQNLPWVVLDMLRPNVRTKTRLNMLKDTVEDFNQRPGQLKMLKRLLENDVARIVEACSSCAKMDPSAANSPVATMQLLRKEMEECEDDADADALEPYERLCLEAFEDCLVLSLIQGNSLGNLTKLARRFRKSLKALDSVLHPPPAPSAQTPAAAAPSAS